MRIEARSSIHPIDAVINGLEGFLELEVGEGGMLDLSVAPKGRLDLPVDRLTSGNALYDREMKRRIDAPEIPLDHRGAQGDEAGR